MQYLLTYDICHPRRLQKVHKYLLAKGIPLQYSVFYLRIDEPSLVQLQQNLHQLIDPQHDDIRIYPVKQFELTMWHKTHLSAVNNGLLVL